MIKQDIELSINPTYECNLNCDFCYLNHTKGILDLSILESKLETICSTWNISAIELYGGEICLLNDVYLLKLILLCKKYTKNISITTNFTIDKPWLFSRSDISINVSWDYIYRPLNDMVFDKIKQYENIGIILTSQKLYDDRYKIVSKLNTLQNHYYIDVKLCMPSNYNNVESTKIKEYQQFVLFLISNLNKNFTLIPLEIINKNNKHSTAHAFISPNGNIEKLKTKSGKEFFDICDNILDVDILKKCSDCKFEDSCLAEHIVEVNDSYDCLGHKKLISIINSLSDYKTYNWRKRRSLSYILNNNIYGDENLSKISIYGDDVSIENLCIKFFETESSLLYPVKSYYVAIVYSWLLNKYFGEDIKTALNYSDLLNNDDKYFVTYDNNKPLYDSLLTKILPNLNMGKYDNSIKSTVSYFKKEFLINDK